jgi:hypothetical protein
VHLDRQEDAVRVAAGIRQLLGSLLIMAGQITEEQLTEALEEQKRSGERLGEVLVRRNLITERQLDSMLAFQGQQGGGEPGQSPLRLGELLVTSGYVSQTQLAEALVIQAATGKQLGRVLVEEGYTGDQQVRRGLRLQQRLLTAALVAMLALADLSLTGCGSGGGGGAPSPTAGVTSPAASAVTTNYLVVTDDAYGLVAPTFYYSTDNEKLWSIQANMAKGVVDVDARCVIRIDSPKGELPLPRLDRTFSIEESPLYERFPGTFFVFNGQKSTNKKVEQGIISFRPEAAAAGRVAGSFDVTMTDYDAPVVPAPTYRLKGVFDFRMGGYGPAS